MFIGDIDIEKFYVGQDPVDKIYLGQDLIYTAEEPEPDYSTMPLTFTITGDGYINWKASSSANTKTIEYSKNDGDWTSITSTTEGVQIPVVSGDTVKFRGNNDQYATSTSIYNTFSGTTCGFNLKGNIMSMVNATDYANVTSLPSVSYIFCRLFMLCNTLTDASNLILPATTLADDCYYAMFQNCMSLTKAPSILPATTLKNSCYLYMFGGCTSLTQAPALPATTLNTGCYQSMFSNCTGLTQAPELPATTLAYSCYSNMFQGCTSLTTAPELPATTLAGSCYQSMFYGCTSLTTAPVLPATKLAQTCYSAMFQGCTSLNYVKCLATNISASNCTNNWVNGVASTGTFVTPSSTNWTTGVDGIPTNWTRVNSDA